MHEFVVYAIVGHLKLFCRKAGQALLEHVDAQRVDTSHQDVDSKVEFVSIYK